MGSSKKPGDDVWRKISKGEKQIREETVYNHENENPINQPQEKTRTVHEKMIMATMMRYVIVMIYSVTISFDLPASQNDSEPDN